MQPHKILTADVLDIIFENRNKTYGAYALRKTYNNRLLIALGTMLAACSLFFVLTVSVGGNHKQQVFVAPETTLMPDPKIDIPKKTETPKVQQKTAPQQKVQTTKLSTPTIVHNIDPKLKENPFPNQHQIDQSNIGNTNTQSNGNITQAIANPNPIQTIEPIKKVDNTIHKTADIPATFPGGMVAWKRYLENHLKAQTVVDAGAPAGLYTIRVQFIVDKEGNISEVQALDDVGYGMSTQAIEVIKKGPHWNAAIKDGTPVNYQAVQRVSFQIQAEE